ncbi:hypothetical protein RRF57_011567 [Xylaria bambusicola]|uniref:Uncharacterized protein n=1 Tax=Xylaria bambusicola TaxID=326684 RepID=A0AAN7Z3T7_9PEZI
MEDIFCRLVISGRILHGDRALQDADAFRVLADNRIQVFGLPKRVFLEPVLEVIIQSNDKVDGLATALLARLNEVTNILGVDKLHCKVGTDLRELLD